uniref:Integrin beta-1 n=1 Tax=Magallana gigas TaxID=29159 RepID=K1QL04_MAGGI
MAPDILFLFVTTLFCSSNLIGESTAQELPDEMSTISRQFKMGFGSFVDKAVMPFVSTAKNKDKSTTTLCNGRGECSCGRCLCRETQKGTNNYYTGKYCECDDTKCPYYGGLICGGLSRGQCICGVCNCNSGFMGDSCGCSTDKSPCMYNDGCDQEKCRAHQGCALCNRVTPGVLTQEQCKTECPRTTAVNTIRRTDTLTPTQENPCLKEKTTTCGECIAISTLCAFCTDSEYDANNYPRCDLLTTHQKLINNKPRCKDIVNPSSTLVKSRLLYSAILLK